MLALLIIATFIVTPYLIASNNLDQNDVSEMLRSDDWFN
jgi:hypothetical protein